MSDDVVVGTCGKRSRVSIEQSGSRKLVHAKIKMLEHSRKYIHAKINPREN